jgi:hypothetical protein
MAGYAVRASGEQRVVSRVIQRDIPVPERGRLDLVRNRVFLTEVEVIGLPEIANDEGLAAWLTVRPQRNINFQLGYNVSTRYDLDSMFFGVGFRFGK